MIIIETQKRIIIGSEKILGAKIVKVGMPKQGMGSSVFLATDERGNEYAIKMSVDVLNDVRALELVSEYGIDIPVPKIFGHFADENKTVIVMEKIGFPLLDDVSGDEKREYVTSMLENLQKIHKVRSDKAGFVGEGNGNKSWRDFLLFKYSGEHPWFDWKEIIRRKGVDGELIQKSIESVRGKIEQADLPEKDFSLLHTDFNQRNLFVDPNTHQIAGIIDWSEAMFGDPLYDFARVRMFIFHFNMREETVQKYFQYLKLTAEEKVREDIYLESQILDYIVWYSEKKNNFNNGRLKLHQDFLRRRIRDDLRVSF